MDDILNEKAVLIIHLTAKFVEMRLKSTNLYSFNHNFRSAAHTTCIMHESNCPRFIGKKNHWPQTLRQCMVVPEGLGTEVIRWDPGAKPGYGV